MIRYEVVLQEGRGILLSNVTGISEASCFDFFIFSTFLHSLLQEGLPCLSLRCWGTEALLSWAPSPPEPIRAMPEGFAFLCTVINLLHPLSGKPSAG